MKYGTTGKPVPGYACKIVDDDGLPVKRGEMGELLINGPTSAIMYWNNREQSRAPSSANGRAPATSTSRTRTAISSTAAAATTCCGCPANTSRRSRSRRALQTHPDVLEAAVVAWPDGDGLIKPKAFVVLKSPEKAADAKAGDAMSRALQDHVKAKLAPYKYPRWIEFRRDLPKTATGKIQRFKLRAEGSAALRSAQSPIPGGTGL